MNLSLSVLSHLEEGQVEQNKSTTIKKHSSGKALQKKNIKKATSRVKVCIEPIIEEDVSSFHLFFFPLPLRLGWVRVSSCA